MNTPVMQIGAARCAQSFARAFARLFHQFWAVEGAPFAKTLSGPTGGFNILDADRPAFSVGFPPWVAAALIRAERRRKVHGRVQGGEQHKIYLSTR